jgi:hypothetical protein
MDLALEVSLFMLRSDVLHAIKSYDMELTASLQLRRKKPCGFILSNSIASARFEPTNLGSNGKYVNHYTSGRLCK